MSDKKRDRPGMVDMIAHVPVEDYMALKSGDAVINNGVRRKNGTIRSNGIVLEDFAESENSCEPCQSADSSQGDHELAKLIREIAAAVVIELVYAATPYMKRWWKDTAVPSIKETWNSFIKKREPARPIKGKNNGQVFPVEIATLNGLIPGAISKGIHEAYENYQENISSEEAQRQLIDIAILSAILADKIKKFSSARINQDGVMPENYLEWQKAMEQLTARKVTDSINAILQSDASLLGEDRAKALSDILGYSVITDGRFVPIENDRIHHALSFKCDAYGEQT